MDIYHLFQFSISKTALFCSLFFGCKLKPLAKTVFLLRVQVAYPDDTQIHDIVDALEVVQLVLTDLDPLLDDVVDYEDDEDDLTSHEEIVVRRHVGHQLHREERGGGLDPAHLQKFKDQSEITIPQFDIEVL